MGMKLLSKSEVAKAQADAKKREIDEGLKLARKVDNLREIKAQEEASLEKFRKDTVSKINEEITALTSQRDTLTSEVAQLKKERKKLMEPLDGEWEKIHEAKLDLSNRENLITSKEETISKQESITRSNLKESKDTLERSILKDERAADLLKSADDANKEATKALKNAKDVEAKALSSKEEVEKELAERDMAMAAKERGLEMRDANLKTKEADLEKEWALLEDRKAMVERRIKNKK